MEKTTLNIALYLIYNSIFSLLLPNVMLISFRDVDNGV